MIIHKILILCVLVSFASISFPQQFINLKAKKEKTPAAYPIIRNYASVGISYELSAPLVAMRNGMNMVHSANLSGAVPLNFISRNIEAGLNLGYGVYAIQSFGLNYQLGNNYVNTSIDYTSSMVQAGASINYYFNRKKKFQPFVGIRAGYATLYTSFRIEDPRDPAACIALDQDVVQSDGTATFGYGSGFRIFTGDAFGASRSFVEFSANMLHGGKVDYVNATHIGHHVQQQPSNTHPGVSAVNIDFRNPSTNNIHQHAIAEMYNNPVRMLQLRLSYVLHFKTK